MNLDNSFETEQSDAYAMRLHSVHPFDFCSRQSRADNEIEGYALFLFIKVTDDN